MLFTSFQGCYKRFKLIKFTCADGVCVAVTGKKCEMAHAVDKVRHLSAAYPPRFSLCGCAEVFRLDPYFLIRALACGADVKYTGIYGFFTLYRLV